MASYSPDPLSARRSMDCEREKVKGRGTEGLGRQIVVITLFALSTCGLAWLVTLPLWQSTAGIGSSFTSLLLPVMMWTPGLAALSFTFVSASRRGLRVAVSDLAIIPDGWRRLAAFSVAGVALTLVIIVSTILISAASGRISLDLLNLSGFREGMGGLPGQSAHAVALIQVAAIPLGIAVNALLAVGEEIGWRGWLHSRLRRIGGLGFTALVTGLLWGLWHTPIILLGYNFNEPNATGVLYMTTGCLTYGLLLSWLRERSGSIWPSVLAHSALNAAAGMGLLLLDARSGADPVDWSPLGWFGWLASGLVMALVGVYGIQRRRGTRQSHGRDGVLVR